jgi:ubiquinone/menaquinone biosynthesis C-methylase UbiE
MAKDGVDFKKLRKKCFSHKNYELNDGLKSYVEKFFSMEKQYSLFLKPIMHYTQIYLFEYMCEFIQCWFNKKENDIKIMDWGCGMGYNSYLCKQRGFDVTACDVSSSLTSRASVIKSYGINCLPLEHPYILSFQDNSFDVLINCGVLEHVPNDTESLKEIYRVLKPNGLLFTFFLPYKYSWRQNITKFIGAYHHERMYTNRHVTNILENSGFKIIDRWFRDLIPLRSHNPYFRTMEKIDNFFCGIIPLKFFASNIEFAAYKP